MKGTILIIISYLIGSIPAGFIVGRLKGIDIREHGSGNIGFTNVLRALGPLPGAVVFAADLSKGIIPVYLSRIFLENEGLPVICGLAAILGHSFTIFLKFKGGKGVLTTTGVFLALAPLPILILLSIFILIVAVTGYVSLGSITCATLLPLLMYLLRCSPLIILIGSVASIFIILKHRTNIRRLLAGKENMFHFLKKSLQSQE